MGPWGALRGPQADETCVIRGGGSPPVGVPTVGWVVGSLLRKQDQGKAFVETRGNAYFKDFNPKYLN